MNSGSSAFISTGGQSAETLAISSPYQTSRPSTQSTLPPVRLTTTIVSTKPAFLIASSALTFSGTLRPPRRPSSAVITTLDLQPSMRAASESGEKPPNTIECTAPMRAQASMA